MFHLKTSKSFVFYCGLANMDEYCHNCRSEIECEKESKKRNIPKKGTKQGKHEIRGKK